MPPRSQRLANIRLLEGDVPPRAKDQRKLMCANTIAHSPTKEEADG